MKKFTEGDNKVKLVLPWFDYQNQGTKYDLKFTPKCFPKKGLES